MTMQSVVKKRPSLVAVLFIVGPPTAVIAGEIDLFATSQPFSVPSGPYIVVIGGIIALLLGGISAGVASLARLMVLGARWHSKIVEVVAVAAGSAVGFAAGDYLIFSNASGFSTVRMLILTGVAFAVGGLTAFLFYLPAWLRPTRSG
jgi:hypothetical protein